MSESLTVDRDPQWDELRCLVVRILIRCRQNMVDIGLQPRFLVSNESDSVVETSSFLKKLYQTQKAQEYC